MSTEMVHSGSFRSRGSQPPDYDDVVHEQEETAGEINLAFNGMTDQDTKIDKECSTALTEEEERMLSILKEVANKCCHANPAKRPTAEEVLKMLKSVENKREKSKDGSVKKR